MLSISKNLENDESSSFDVYFIMSVLSSHERYSYLMGCFMKFINFPIIRVKFTMACEFPIGIVNIVI